MTVQTSVGPSVIMASLVLLGVVPRNPLSITMRSWAPTLDASVFSGRATAGAITGVGTHLILSLAAGGYDRTRYPSLRLLRVNAAHFHEHLNGHLDKIASRWSKEEKAGS